MSFTIVDAGNDTTYCVRIYPIDTYYLGENASIENAVGPVQIAWECELPVGTTNIFTASIPSHKFSE